MPSVTENTYGKGKAYYVAFRNDNDLAEDFCRYIVQGENIYADTGIISPNGVTVRKRGRHIFIMNFTDEEKSITLDREYTNALTNEIKTGEIVIGADEYLILQ